jgi:DNA-binding CsgD family transcriptional regulator
MLEASSEAPKREEQVLVLAAGGLTDKEIAIRLGISPDTVGTYWRRVLAKYQAASRTECVAKYMDSRNKQSLQNLQFVNECLNLVNEHLIEHGISDAGASNVADAILASIRQWVLLIGADHSIVFSNKPTNPGASLLDVFQGESVLQSLELASQGPVEALLTDENGDVYEFILNPGTGAVRGLIVACGRSA